MKNVIQFFLSKKVIKMKQNQIKSVRERKNVVKSFRITETQNKKILTSNRTIDEIFELGLILDEDDNVELILRKKEIKKKMKDLKFHKIELENELDNLNNNLIKMELELQEINDELKDTKDSLKEYYQDKAIVNSIQVTLDYYFKSFNPENNPLLSFGDFMVIKESYVKSQATRCGLELEEFKSRLLDEFDKVEKQEILV